MLHSILCLGIKHFVSLWIVVAAEIMRAGKTNSQLEYVSIPVEMNHCLFQNGRFPVYFSLPCVWLFSQRDDAILGYQCQFLLLANLTFGWGSRQINLNELDLIILGLCIESISVVMATLFTHHYATTEVVKGSWLMSADQIICLVVPTSLVVTALW